MNMLYEGPKKIFDLEKSLQIYSVCAEKCEFLPSFDFSGFFLPVLGPRRNLTGKSQIFSEVWKRIDMTYTKKSRVLGIPTPEKRFWRTVCGDLWCREPLGL